ncbi:MAG: STAS domain-containing protein [Magnetococcus sp. DMHC-6]
MVSIEGNEVIVKLPETFGYAIRKEFRQFTSKNTPGIHYTFDFENVEKMESSALGMLLMLREVSGGEKDNIVLTNANSNIRKILQFANFHTMFKII